MVLEGQVCYSLPLLSPVHAGHREGQRGLRMRVYPTCVSFTCGIPLVHSTLPAWARIHTPLVELDITRLQEHSA